MNMLKSGIIKNIEEKNDKYMFHFSLYRDNLHIPYNMGMIYAKTSFFEKMTFSYYIRDFNKEVDFGFFDANLVMIADMSFDQSNLYLILPKSNHKIVDKITDCNFSFEIFINEENPKMCSLVIDDNKLSRNIKLKKIKEKINDNNY